jgi:hypothetical protein
VNSRVFVTAVFELPDVCAAATEAARVKVLLLTRETIVDPKVTVDPRTSSAHVNFSTTGNHRAVIDAVSDDLERGYGWKLSGLAHYADDDQTPTPGEHGSKWLAGALTVVAVAVWALVISGLVPYDLDDGVPQELALVAILGLPTGAAVYAMARQRNRPIEAT